MYLKYNLNKMSNDMDFYRLSAGRARTKRIQKTPEELQLSQERRIKSTEKLRNELKRNKGKGAQAEIIARNLKGLGRPTEDVMARVFRGLPKKTTYAASKQRENMPSLHIRAVSIRTSEPPVNQNNKFTGCVISATGKGMVTGSLYDPSMRPCQADPTVTGMGLIRFAAPIINPNHVKDIVNILKLICYKCYNFVVPISADKTAHILSLPAKDRTGELQDIVPNAAACSRCHGVEGRKYFINESDDQGRVLFEPVVRRPRRTRKTKKEKTSDDESTSGQLDDTEDEGPSRPKKTTEQTTRSEVPISEIEKILSGITRETAELLGYNLDSMENFIAYGLQVPSTECRPDVSYKGQVDKKVSNISVLLEKVILCNEELANKKARSEGGVAQASYQLFCAVSAYISHIYAIHQTKEGLARKNSLGKRSDITTRTTLKAAAYQVPFGWAEIPQHDEEKLVTLLDVVPGNLFLCRQLLAMKQIVKIEYHSGRSAGNTTNVLPTMNYEINVGDKVAIRAMHGDWITGFRAPTIHRHSVIGVRSRLIQASVVGINMALTTPMNADFDGDEITLTKPPSLASQHELIHRLDVRRNMKSSQTGTPILGAVFNASSSIYRITQPGTRINARVMAECLDALSNRDQLATLQARLVQTGIHRLSGRALFSALLPEGLKYDRKPGANVDKSAPAEEIKIRNGILIRGTIDKTDIGPGVNGNILDLIIMGYGWGWRRAAKFITDIYRISAIWDEYNLLSVGYNSIAAAFDPKVRNEMMREFDRIELETLDPNLTDIEFRQRTELNMGERVINYDNEHQLRLGLPRNSLAIMGDIGAKSKGGIANINDTHSMKGTQMNSQGLMPRDMTSGTRAMSSFRPGESTPEARGFIKENYSIGLRSNSFFFACMRDRESLAQTATGVSKVGDMRNKLAIAVSNIGIFNNMTKDAETGLIYQTAYGFDGLDVAKTIKYQGKTTFIDLETAAARLSARSGYVEEIEVEALDSDSLGLELFRDLLQIADRTSREFDFTLSTDEELEEIDAQRYLAQLPPISHTSLIDASYEIGENERVFTHEDITYKIVYGDPMDKDRYSYIVPISGPKGYEEKAATYLGYGGDQLPVLLGSRSILSTGVLTEDEFIPDKQPQTCSLIYDPDIYG